MQSDSMPTADTFFPACPSGTLNMSGWMTSFWMANGVGAVVFGTV